jgi:hypothetical protein
MSHAAWFEAHTADAPPVLRARMRELARGEGSAEGLAAAAIGALAGVAAHPGDRTIALDLLAADGLITLALLRRATESPASLGAFGAELTGKAGR